MKQWIFFLDYGKQSLIIQNEIYYFLIQNICKWLCLGALSDINKFKIYN